MARPLALFQQTLALDSAIAGSRLPLVAISQGTGGGAETHYFYNTVLALAEVGFIVAAMSHTDHNWRGHAYTFFIPCNFP